MKGSKIFSILIVILAVVLIYGAVKLGWFGATKEPAEIQDDSRVVVEYLEQGRLAPELPTDLPTEEGAPMQRNEIVRAKDGSETQHVYRYYSSKTIEENYKIYNDYLEKGGWRILNSVKTENLVSLVADKDGKRGIMQVSISKNSITGDVTVEVNVVVR